ncbi:hypothetical protein EJV47_14805 [Hymenobacter gummosus]|uniref:Uncharacterized protein n=1 Tax=Hymenobacter gummosus TaxID=1776032 RepID=A0A3S0QH84_9BACT|nr:CZB domain-containing protein [Hymenobacter gummosus]RTQ48864.1 hypothetical protein EJV47_14805 [Hymenobacter gummosus]
MDLTSLDFQQARIKQVLFKSRLRSVLYGVREADPTLFSVRDNPLGQWLETIVKPRYGTMPQVREIERLLQDTLNTGQALVRQYQRGQIEEARKGLEQVESRTEQIDALLQSMAGQMGTA